VKKTISDTLAWVAFSALVVWIAAVGLTLTSYWQTVSDVMALIEEVKACASNQCESQVFLERLSSTTTAFGFNTDQVKSVRMPAFATWFTIIIFQSFFVRSFRVWPWQSNPRSLKKDRSPSRPSPSKGRSTVIKVVTLLKRKQGLSREQFRDHYENVHRHLGEKYLFPHAIRYVCPPRCRQSIRPTRNRKFWRTRRTSSIMGQRRALPSVRVPPEAPIKLALDLSV
jgi:hypothetical protein